MLDEVCAPSAELSLPARRDLMVIHAVEGVRDLIWQVDNDVFDLSPIARAVVVMIGEEQTAVEIISKIVSSMTSRSGSRLELPDFDGALTTLTAALLEIRQAYEEHPFSK